MQWCTYVPTPPALPHTFRPPTHVHAHSPPTPHKPHLHALSVDAVERTRNSTSIQKRPPPPPDIGFTRQWVGRSGAPFSIQDSLLLRCQFHCDRGPGPPTGQLRPPATQTYFLTPPHGVLSLNLSPTDQYLGTPPSGLVVIGTRGSPLYHKECCGEPETAAPLSPHPFPCHPHP